MMNWILLVMAAIAAVVIAMLLGGLMAPRERVAVRTLRAAGPMEALYVLARQADGPPRWCANLPTMRLDHDDPPRALAFTLFDDDGAAMGTWQMELAIDGDGTTSVLRIREIVQVNNLLLRFVRSLGGDGRRPRMFLESMARELGVHADLG